MEVQRLNQKLRLTLVRLRASTGMLAAQMKKNAKNITAEIILIFIVIFLSLYVYNYERCENLSFL